VKLHDLKPAPGSHKAKRRVGRGIAAGQGKTAGRGTKGQKARAGGNLPAWFEGGQTPLHQRLPKLHGFRNPFRVEYEIVNVGDVARLVELGVLEAAEMPGGKPSKSGNATNAPITVNQEILRAAGLVRTLDRPLKVLGSGDLSSPLFVVADAFSASARSKIEAAGGSANVIEVPGKKTRAMGRASAAPAEVPAAGRAESDEAPASEGAAAEMSTIEIPSEPVKKPARRAKAAPAEAPTEAAAEAPAEAAPETAPAEASAEAPESPEPAAESPEAAPQPAPATDESAPTNDAG
jgi:large subunit ribosomal protein L15